MNQPIAFVTVDAVVAALHDSALQPPPPPASLGHGSTAKLRAAMARFSDRDRHAPRRVEVDALLYTIDPAIVRSIALDATTRLLAGERSVDLVVDVAFRVPTETMVIALGLPGDRSAIVTDVRAVAEVIGRGASASERSDTATERLLVACGDARCAAIAIASLLYQSHDATAALLIETVTAEHYRTDRKSAVTHTRRVAVSDTAIGDVTVPAGSQVVLDLASSGLEFGTGPHECPARSVAEAIVEGITAAIDGAGFVVLDVSATVDSNGRADSIIIGVKS